MRAIIEKAGRLDGIQYYNITHNGHLIYNGTYEQVNELLKSHHLPDVIAAFYTDNPHLHDGSDQMKFTKVRKSHLATAQLIADHVNLDYIGGSTGIEYDADNVEFIEVMAAIKPIAMSESITYERLADPRRISEWLRGLPTALTVPYWNHEVYNWLYKHTKLTENDTADKHIKAQDDYWRMLGYVINYYAEKGNK